MESPERPAERDDVGIGPAGGGPVALELMGIAQRVGRGGADRQVVRVQILQGAARLGNDGFDIVLNDRQRGPDRGNPSDQVRVLSSGSRACRAASAAWSFCFDGGMSADKE